MAAVRLGALTRSGSSHSLVRANSHNAFKPIPEDEVPHSAHGTPGTQETRDYPGPLTPGTLHAVSQDSPCGRDSQTRTTNHHTQRPLLPASKESHRPLDGDTQSETEHHPDTRQTPTRPPQVSTADAGVQELRRLLVDLQQGRQDNRHGGGSRPGSRCSLISSSRQGSRFGSRRSSFVPSDDEDEEEKEVEVSGSQKAHLLVASQQRLVYSLQGLRHGLTALDEEVDRIRNDVLNSRRFFNAMRGVPGQPTWGSAARRLGGSGSSSPSLYSLDNSSYSDDTESLIRSDSCCSFASWRSESELYGVFRDAGDDGTGSDKGSAKSPSNPRNAVADSCNHHTGPSGKEVGGGVPKFMGRYRQLGTPNHRASPLT